MDARKAAYERVLAACVAAFDGPLAALRGFMPSAPPAAYRDIAPAAKPVIGHLETARAATTPDLLPLVDAIIEGAPHFHWKTSYSLADGIDQDFMDRYGYFDLATPAGPFLTGDYRLTVAFWGAGLIYPEHRHEPEELYTVIAGDVVFRAAGRAPRRVGPGGVVHHESNQLHATDMVPGPMLSVVGWKGANLMKFARMDRGRSV